VRALRSQYPKQFNYETHNYGREIGRQQAQTLGVSYYPAIVLIDHNGTITRRFAGLVSVEQMQPELEAIIQESGVRSQKNS
jgi:hypothetical protein